MLSSSVCTCSYHPQEALKSGPLKLSKTCNNLAPRHYKDRNVLLLKDDGIVLHFHNYKMKRFSGRGELALQSDHGLCTTLVEYTRNFRPHLTREERGNVLPLVSLYRLVKCNGQLRTECSPICSVITRVITGNWVTFHECQLIRTITKSEKKGTIHRVSMFG